MYVLGIEADFQIFDVSFLFFEFFFQFLDEVELMFIK
jgi:hypothetical protein